jgi:hypothetical protein
MDFFHDFNAFSPHAAVRAHARTHYLKRRERVKFDLPDAGSKDTGSKDIDSLFPAF